MAKEKKNDSEEKGGAAAHAAEEKKPASGGGAGGLLKSTPALLGVVMLVEAMVLFAGFKMFSGPPHSAAASDATSDEEGGHGEGGHGEAGAHGGPIKGEKRKVVELQVLEFKAPNKQSGRLFLYDVSVFVNCPFDPPYEPMMRALTFAVYDCGFFPRSALEEDNAGEVRYHKIIRIIDNELDSPHDWEQFAVHFDSVHTDYLKNLKDRFPDLTASELKLCAYLRMNLSTKEISQLMNISIRGVETNRYRLRKKLDLPNETNLVDFLLKTN